MLLVPLVALSAVPFLYYGLACIWSPRLQDEYLRYGIPNLRVVSGILQLLGAAGVVIGLVVAPLGATAAAGLCIMMVLGVGVRVRMRDCVRLMVPATSLALINSALVWLFVAQ
jgi:hypothetical protein